MILIAGLGNPEKKYDRTRHNAGFHVIDALSEKYGISVTTKKFKGLMGTGVIEGMKVLLLKPQTYMNLSGESIAAAAGFYGIAPSDVIVISDDVYLDLGLLRIRASGSAGGHNGLKNIIALLGSQDFPRVRVGVGKQPADMDLIPFVLSEFNKAEWAEMNDAFQRAAEAAVAVMTEGVPAAMNRFNGKRGNS